MQDYANRLSDKKIIIIIPAFNEGPVLLTLLEDLLDASYCVIVIDDGSDTPLQNILKKLPVYYLRHRSNLGQGAALQTGFEFAKTLNPDFVITMDADGQHGISSIPTLIEPLIANEVDIVLGSRFLSNEETSIPYSKKIVLKTARIVNYVFSGLLLSDAHNGLRAFNKKTLEKLTITENRMAHASEILFDVKKQKLRFKEVPVKIAYTIYSKQKGQSTWDSIRILFDLILYKLFK